MSSGFPWNELGLAKGSDAGAIRRAYAARLKAMDPDADPDGYARLRQARDTALRLARASGSAPDAVVETISDDAPERPLPFWSLSGSVFLCDGHGDLKVAIPVQITPCPPLADGFAEAIAAPVGNAMPFPFAPPVLNLEMADVRPVQRPDARLYRLLLEMAQDLEPLSEEEEAEARTCLRCLLHDATTGSLARHDAIEDWLADTLARSWPRCAPLLEEAAIALDWQRHAGRLGESRQIAFLTARLAGYHFQRDVQSPLHPHHAAWKELSREGEAGLLRRITFRPKRISALLQHLRQNHPELEDTLNHFRIQSWMKSDGRNWSFSWYVPAAIMAFRLLASLTQPDAAPSQVAALSDPEFAPRMEQVVKATFGPDHSSEWLKTHQEELARTLAANLSLSQSDQKVEHIAADIARVRSYAAARLAGGKELDQAMQVRLAVADALKEDGRICTQFLTKGVTPDDFPPDAALSAAARKLFAAQAEAGRLVSVSAIGPANAKVPGELVTKVMKETGLKMDDVRDAMQNKGDPTNRCNVNRALIRATLKWQGKEHAPILLTL
ncbi:hypothetical protein [Novosphingobium sediminicola]|uniref:J domain-containing protein n=1 Tax=Novosphingobium sediminicola TaxID=563162 RepID=A0A7W6G8A3_9SPHN|nr:hypothetical protein [Novosphingobium sediminicola]MBB3957101.1 hypothetical protein [Novosphingobium sediminicola]